MLQLKNSTPFAANITVLPDEDGIDSLYINVKARFNIGSQWTLAEEQTPPQEEDVYWEEPGSSSLKYASDFHLGKPATDIVMLGEACAPGQASVRQLDVNLTVANLSKTIRVFGDRVWTNGQISAPAAFQTMPLLYERAFGGTQHGEGGGAEGTVMAAEERNPVGLGFRGTRPDREMEGAALPNLEDPRCLIRSTSDCPEPACFGFRAPNWRPRAALAGTYDDQWLKNRAPYLPADYSRSFVNAAHPDLVYGGFLQGGEAVVITNMHPNGDLRFNLPCIKLAGRVEMAGSTETPPFNLETVLLEPNQLQVSLVWKAKVRCDKKALKIKQVSIALSR